MGKNYKGLKKKLNKLFFFKVYKLALETKMDYFMKFFRKLPYGYVEATYTNINYSLVTWWDSLKQYISRKECFPFLQYLERDAFNKHNITATHVNYYGYYAQQLTRLLVLYNSKIPTYMLTDYAPYQGNYMVRNFRMTYEPIVYNDKGNIRLSKMDQIPNNITFTSGGFTTWQTK